MHQLKLLKPIGKGAFGEVYLSTIGNQPPYCATKKLDKKKIDRPQIKKYLYTEISILKLLNHKNIVKLIDAIQTPSFYFITMEYCNGGSLLDCLNKYKAMYKKPFSEEIVQYLMKQIVEGLKYIHKHDIIHRDIKLANILVKFYSDDDLKKIKMMKVHIKIGDFGISIKGKEAFTVIGPPLYMDPFILKKMNERNDLVNSDGYDQSADIWSLGAVCYEMLTGKKVFNGRNLSDLCQKVEEGNYTLPNNVSKEVVSFINGMLQYDSSKRLDIDQISKHDFLNRPVKEFSKIDLDLYGSKISKSGIKMNTKSDIEEKINTINSLLNLTPIDEFLDKNTVPIFPNNSQFKIENLNKNNNNISAKDEKNNNANINNNNNKKNNININNTNNNKNITTKQNNIKKSINTNNQIDDVDVRRTDSSNSMKNFQSKILKKETLNSVNNYIGSYYTNFIDNTNIVSNQNNLVNFNNYNQYNSPNFFNYSIDKFNSCNLQNNNNINYQYSLVTASVQNNFMQNQYKLNIP